MSNVHFIYPWRLTALLLCAALAWLPHSGRSAWHRLLDKPFRSLIIHRRRRLANLLPWLLALGVIALAGPTWQRELPGGADAAKQCDGYSATGSGHVRRGSGAFSPPADASKIAALMQRLPGAHFGLVVYSSQAFLTTPLTQDPQFIAFSSTRKRRRSCRKARAHRCRRRWRWR
ncbi:Uncharacterised protein [Raoultella terrigena]|uniref:Uncharacterized protein n=1 Tax=Raoultella terrigena TaxID=577 RepID=A0A4U9D2B1_RAOTE|nr:Uncharacterised protein [Raoultella terrigena]